MDKAVSAEILHTASCGHWEAACSALQRVAAENSIGLALQETLVASEAEARLLRFPGSPTIRVGGRDLEPDVEARGDFSLG